MRRLLCAVCFVVAAVPALAAEQAVVRFVEFDDVIVTGATANRIIDALDEAQAAGDDLVLIQLDTPGGLVTATQDIVKHVLGSPVPVVVWVGPSGAHAASAGFFIMLSADIASMAPGTRCGAASTVYSEGESKEDDVGLKKSNEDLAALMRSIAERRGRNVEKAEQAVFAADAYSETEALEAGLVEIVARDRDDLLAQLDGREVKRFHGESVVLHTANARIVTVEWGFRQKLFEFLATPTVASILLMLGLAGLYVEMSHPGLVFPAVIGALCLILFFFAAAQLPISTIGVLLIVLGIVMFVLEIKVASYGMLTLGGAVCLGIGLMMLVEGPIPELRVPPQTVVPTVLTFTALAAFVVRLAVRAQHNPVRTGVEGIAGEIGTVVQDLGPVGKVFVHGELWNATAAAGPLPSGSRVRVVRVDDMMLTVELAERRSEGSLS